MDRVKRRGAVEHVLTTGGGSADSSERSIVDATVGAPQLVGKLSHAALASRHTSRTGTGTCIYVTVLYIYQVLFMYGIYRYSYPGTGTWYPYVSEPGTIEVPGTWYVRYLVPAPICSVPGAGTIIYGIIIPQNLFRKENSRKRRNAPLPALGRASPPVDLQHTPNLASASFDWCSPICLAQPQ